MKYPASIQNLVDYFSKLPTVGQKTAERYVFYLLKQHPEDLQRFAQAIAELKEKTTICRLCLAVAEKDPCFICENIKRDKKKLMVVASTRELAAMEATNQFDGIYLVLGGLLNTINGIKPETLNVQALIDKIKNTQLPIEEIILSLSPNLEGETTMLYLIKLLKPYKIKISRLAKGLPVGADLEYADEITLSNALKYRSQI